MSSTVARAEVLRALECAKCRSLVEQATSGDAEDLGETLALGGATEEGVARHLARTWEGATHRSCHACGRTVTLLGSTLHLELLRPVVPRLDCARCASFVDACGGPLLPPRRGFVTVQVGAAEPARAYGHGRLVLEDFRCGTCRRVVRTDAVGGARVVSIEIDANDGPLGTPPPGPRILLAEADASVECARCSGLLREVAPAELFLADAGRTIAFCGGSLALLEAHFGPGSAHDRTCPECFRQTCLETDLGGRFVRNGRGRMEIQPGGLGPLADGCEVCGPIIEEAVAGPRHVLVSPELDRSFQTREAVVSLPLTVWDAIQLRFHTSRGGDEARCDACGRYARVVRYAAWPVELGVRARHGAARSRRAPLDCPRCEAFVASEEFAMVVGKHVELHADPEKSYGPAAHHSPGRYSVSMWKCADCAREILCESDPAGWIVKVALSRP